MVASEVRAWPDAVAEAAKEIKSLINASVESGTRHRLVDQAGTTMNEVVSSIKRVTDIMGEISAASNEAIPGRTSGGRSGELHGPDHTAKCCAGGGNGRCRQQSQSQAQELVQTVAVFKLARPGSTGQDAGARQRLPVPNPLRAPERRASGTPKVQRLANQPLAKAQARTGCKPASAAPKLPLHPSPQQQLAPAPGM